MVENLSKSLAGGINNIYYLLVLPLISVPAIKKNFTGKCSSGSSFIAISLFFMTFMWCAVVVGLAVFLPWGLIPFGVAVLIYFCTGEKN